MKIAHISQTDGGAGAGRAAYRIHRSLLELGVSSSMLVGQKRTEDVNVYSAVSGPISRQRVRFFEYFEAKLAQWVIGSTSQFFSPAQFGYFDPMRDPRVSSADAICLYWINGAYISPDGLKRLNKPVVWRLSDTWPFTGGCHYTGTCERYTVGCGECPQLDKPSKMDLSHRLWKRKELAWRDLDLTIAAPSHWIAGLARNSALFSQKRIEVIPTGIDLSRYRPLDRKESRAKFGIPQDKSVILFGAMDPSADSRKGYAELRDALSILAQGPLADRIIAVVFGNMSDKTEKQPLPTKFVGHLNDDEMLAAAYSMADVVVVPSLEDNLPNTALEAIACGTPVVGFNIGGMPDIVRHDWNGALVDLYDTAALAAEIGRLLENSAQRQSMSINARLWAEEHFSLKQQAQSYLQLYGELIGRPSVK